MEKATRHLQLALQHPDFSLGSRLLLGQICQRTGDLRQAAVEFLEALRLADAASVSPDQADILDQLYEPLVEAQTQSDDAQLQQQLCDNISGLLMRADWRDHLRQARQQLPIQTDGGPPVPLAEVLTQARSSQIVESLTTIYQLERAGNLRSAMEEAFYALQYAPTYLHLHITIGELLLKQGQVTEAIEKFLAVAQAYTSRGEGRRAISMYRRVIELTPVEMHPRARLIEILTSMGYNEEALDEYMEVAEMHYSMADRGKARKAYVDALRLRSSLPVTVPGRCAFYAAWPISICRPWTGGKRCVPMSRSARSIRLTKRRAPAWWSSISTWVRKRVAWPIWITTWNSWKAAARRIRP